MGVNFGLYRENYYPAFTNYLPIFPFVRALLLMAMYSDQNDVSRRPLSVGATPDRVVYPLTR